MGSCRGAPWYAELRRRPGCRRRCGRRKKKRGLVAGTGRRTSRPRKEWREKPIPDEGGEAADRQRAKAGCRRCPELKLGLGCSSRGSGSFRREQHANCAGEDAQVQAQAPVLDVGEIKVHVEFERRTVASGNLPETGDAGFHVKAPVVVKFVMADLVHRMRTLSNQTHLPAQHVPELREF